MREGFLALEDGTIYRGISVGAEVNCVAEVCFNTSMSGYQEILTDPSYKGQMVAMTYPEIGNYGVNREDVESFQPHVSGFIMRELSPVASNWRSESSLGDYLKQNKIPALKEIDTRALTKRLREIGAMKGFLCGDGSISEEEAVQQAKEWHGLEGVDYVKEVTSQKIWEWDASGEQSAEWQDAHRLKENGVLDVPKADLHVVAYDFGVKTNILRCLRRAGFRVTVVPASTDGEEVLKLNPDGVFLSNGPGDPSAVTYAYENVRKLIGKVPIFGICMGNQILGQALGGKTFKLKFGHRGGNQPVKDLATGRVAITSQNHGFAIDGDSLGDDVEVSHINLNDGTCEGLKHKKYPVFSVQYHPEASPGPHDAEYLFSEFRKVIEAGRNSVKPCKK